MWGKVKKFLFNWLIAIDQLANALTGGSPDQCLSTRLWLNYPNSFLRKLVDAVLGKDHCKRSADNDRQDGVLR